MKIFKDLKAGDTLFVYKNHQIIRYTIKEIEKTDNDYYVFHLIPKSKQGKQPYKIYKYTYNNYSGWHYNRKDIHIFADYDEALHYARLKVEELNEKYTYYEKMFKKYERLFKLKEMGYAKELI